MPGIEWSDTEKIISVYFASHGVHHNVIVKLLHLRGFNRTVHGVDNQMVVLRRKSPALGSPGLWNIEGVNQWLFEHLGSLGEDIPTLEDFSVIQQVCK